MELKCPLPRRNPEMVGSTHLTHATQPLPWTPLIPHLQRGEMSLGLPWALLLVSHPGIPATRVPRRARKVAKKQSWLIFMAFWRPSEERWQLTELLTPQFSDWKRDKGSEGNEEEKGLGSVLYSVFNPHYLLSCFSLLG